MKLQKRFTVEGEEYPLVSEQIRLDIDRPGMALIQVLADKPLAGRVEYALGWNFSPALTLFFTGEIDTSTPAGTKQQRLLCRELSARIDKAAPVALRHPTMKEVLARYASLTGLSFIVPERPYADTRIPAFYGFGSAFQAMHNLGEVFHIEDYVWLTQADGRIFAGSWADSRWKGKEVEIPRGMFKKVSADGECTMAAAPAIRPGCVVNGARVQSVTLSGIEMSFKCKPF